MTRFPLLIVSSLLFSASALALPVGGYGSSVSTYSKNVWPKEIGNTMPCGSADCGHPDLVYEEHKSEFHSPGTGTGTGADRYDIYIHTDQYGYESATRAVKAPGTIPEWGSYLPREGTSNVNTYGYADAGASRMGASSSAHSWGAAPLTTAQTETEIGNRLIVGAGTSGLKDGDTVRLAMNLRLDGQVNTSAVSYPDNTYAGTHMWAGFRVAGQGEHGQIDYDNPLMVFGADLEMSAGDVYAPYWKHSYSADMEQSYWGRTNTGQRISFSDSSHRQEQGWAAEYLESFAFDTGLLTLEFDAIIGSELSFLGYLEVWASASGNARAWNDFSHTFGSNVFSLVEGTELNWLIPDLSDSPVAVPEPGTVGLLVLGLLAVWGCRRRESIPAGLA